MEELDAIELPIGSTWRRREEEFVSAITNTQITNENL